MTIITYLIIVENSQFLLHQSTHFMVHLVIMLEVVPLKELLH